MDAIQMHAQAGRAYPAVNITEPIVLVVGNPIDGLTLYGPSTANDPQLEDFIERELNQETWWYAPLQSIPGTGDHGIGEETDTCHDTPESSS